MLSRAQAVVKVLEDLINKYGTNLAAAFQQGLMSPVDKVTYLNALEAII